MFNFVINVSLAIIVIVLSKLILRDLRVSRYKGYYTETLKISSLYFVALLYVVALIVMFVI